MFTNLHTMAVATAEAGSMSDTQAAVAEGLVIAFVVIIAVVFYAIPYFAVMWQLYKKAGVAGWKAIIPIYNTYMMGQIGKKPKLGLVAAIMSVVSILSGIIVKLVPGINIVDVLISLINLGLGLAVLYFFVIKFTAGLGRWVLFLFFPIIGAFLVKPVQYKDAVTSSEGGTTNTGQPLPPAFVPASQQTQITNQTEASSTLDQAASETSVQDTQQVQPTDVQPQTFAPQPFETQPPAPVPPATQEPTPSPTQPPAPTSQQ